MSIWDPVRAELDCWAAERRVATFWWRDDDAKVPSAQLRGMLTTAQRYRVCLGLSVIPALANRSLAACLDEFSNSEVLIHGFQHFNHARAGRAKCEFGGGRDLAAVEKELRRAIEISEELFGNRLIRVFVPPWNRISPGIVAILPRLGIRGLSTWKPRLFSNPVPGLQQTNVHLDLVDWRHKQAIKSDRLLAALLLRKLRWRRARPVRAEEPLGLLTHHALWNSQMEDVTIQIIEATHKHSAVKWFTPKRAFGL